MAPVAHVRAQARLDVNYSISLAGFSIADLTLSAEINASDYSISINSRIRSFVRAPAGGTGSSSARGIVEGPRLVPTKYSATSNFEGEPLEISMTFEDGNVKEVTASKSSRDRPLLAGDVHRQAVLDPLTGFLIPGGLSEEACRRTLRVFDGYQRYDVGLAFKRMGKVNAKDGYAGPALVCSARYKPVAGNRGSATMPSFAVDFLAGHDVEVMLVPVSGTQVLAPFQVTLATMLGNLMAQASRFKTTAQ